MSKGNKRSVHHSANNVDYKVGYVNKLKKLVRHADNNFLKVAIDSNIENHINIFTKIKFALECNTHHGTIIHYAALRGELKIVETLLKYCGTYEINAKSREGFTPLMYATYYNPNVKIIELLIKHGANINTQASDGSTCLIEAVKNHNKDVVKLLIEHGAEINTKMANGQNAIQIAKCFGSDEMLALLAKYNKSSTETEGLYIMSVAQTKAMVAQCVAQNQYYKSPSQLKFLQHEQNKLFAKFCASPTIVKCFPLSYSSCELQIHSKPIVELSDFSVKEIEDTRHKMLGEVHSELSHE
jgi:hypothetical protein